MNFKGILRGIEKRSGGEVKIVKTPENKRPTEESTKKLSEEIGMYVKANRAVAERSLLYASGGKSRNCKSSNGKINEGPDR